jgi:hypothetical protein
MDEASKKIRIRDVAAAIDTNPKVIRNWISRYADKGVRPTVEQTGTWLEFSFGDTAALAITKYLVELGMPAFNAFATAMKVIEARWPGLFEEQPAWTMSHDRLLMPFYRDSRGEWASEGYERWLPKEPPPLSTRVTIILGVGNIVMEVFRALESVGYPLPRPQLEGPMQAAWEREAAAWTSKAA